MKFVDKFHTVSDLALSDEDEVLKYWQGLGYYSRARNLHKAAKFVHFQCQGNFPCTFHDLLQLPGVGDYTASAIAAFAFNERQVAVDGNVKRLASRWFGIELPIDKPAFVAQAKKELMVVLDEGSANPAIFNQAIIELGATVCTPTLPKCGECPVQSTCLAYRQNLQLKLPVVAKKKKPKPVSLHYFALEKSGKWALVQRDESSVWANLFEFPNTELDDFGAIPAVGLQKILGIDWVEQSEKQNNSLGDTSAFKFKGYRDFKHLLSHRRIQARCWNVSVQADIKLPIHWRWFDAAEIGSLAVHRLMEKMLEFVQVWK